MRKPTPEGPSPAAQFYRALIAMGCAWCEVCGHYHPPGGAHISLGRFVRVDWLDATDDETDVDHDLVVSDQLRAILDTVDDGEVPA